MPVRHGAATPIPVDREVWVETHIRIIECANCSIDFGIGEDFRKRRREDHDTFYCPNGHSNFYPQKDEAAKQRERADGLEQRLKYALARATSAEDQAQAAEYSRRAQKAVNTKLRKRIAAGVCPCCNRTFQDLLRHMKGQHPDYVESHEGGD